jgi:hypothetical protein
MISRIPELQPCPAFVLVWAQLGIKHNTQTTELHPKMVQRTSLSLGGKMDNVSCMVFISLHIFSTGFILGTCAGHSVGSHWSAVTNVLPSI